MIDRIHTTPADPAWTHRLGFLVPSVNTVFERDLRLSLPGRLSTHVARLPITRDEPDQLCALSDAAPAAAELLAHAGCDIVSFACTTGSLYQGLGFDDEIRRRVTAVTGRPTSTTSTGVIAALRSVGAQRVLLVSPYENWLEERVKAFLGAHGMRTTAALGPALPDPRDCAALAPQAIADIVDDPGDADAVLLSCTAMRGLEAAALLRRRLRVPVVSSNEATIWAVLRDLGLAPEPFGADGDEVCGDVENTPAGAAEVPAL